jgi:hypothetical protein
MPDAPGRTDTEDVVELILADHAEMERLLRELRDDTSDRRAVVHELADLLVGHARAEEDVVYPVLERRADAEGEDEVEDEVEHGEEERNVLNPARELVPAPDREELGRRFLQARARELSTGPGSLPNVRAEVARDRERGLLD